MTLGSRRTILVAAGTAVAWLVGVALAIGQAGPGPRPQMAEEAFKNVQVLKGIPVDEFMGTMGVFSAALGLSCEDCHEANDSNWANYALDTGMKKRTARRMVLMMSAINQSSFGGRQVVTCYTCHRGSTSPRVTPSLAALYGASPSDETGDDIVAQAPGAPAADQILDKYIQALGGAGRLASLTSLVLKGTSVGYGPEGQKRQVEVFAKAPGLRTTIIHTLDGDSTTTYDGRAAWIAAPHRPVPVLALTGDDLEGVKLESALFFPAQIKRALGRWRVGFPGEIDDRPVQVVQGTSAGGALATMYFDVESGLLVRFLHYAQSPVGRMPTQIDYADYRDVSGVKVPFRWKVTWLDGVESVEVVDVQPNVPIDAAKFAKPAASTK
jgi:photosynthetic reaction center cytochrome c subunit